MTLSGLVQIMRKYACQISIEPKGGDLLVYVSSYGAHLPCVMRNPWHFRRTVPNTVSDDDLAQVVAGAIRELHREMYYAEQRVKHMLYFPMVAPNPYPPPAVPVEQVRNFHGLPQLGEAFPIEYSQTRTALDEVREKLGKKAALSLDQRVVEAYQQKHLVFQNGTVTESEVEPDIIVKEKTDG